MDLRERVLRAVDGAEGTQAEVAERFAVSLRWVQKLLRLRRETGSAGPRAHGGGRPAKFLGSGLERLKRQVEQHPDLTLQDLLDRCGVAASIMAVHRALVRLGFRRKKRRSGPVSRTARTSRRSGRLGFSGPPSWPRSGWCSSTKAGPRPI